MLIIMYILRKKVFVSYIYLFMSTTCFWSKISMDAIKQVNMQLSSKFDMKDIDATKFILGIDTERDRIAINIWLNHRKHIEIFLKYFKMQDWKPIKVSIPIGEKLAIE
jgi:hypothetical protein